jgi:hypothetical protein
MDSMKDATRVALLNAVGLVALVVFTSLVYLRTQEPLILLVGGLVSVVSVIGSAMGRS